MANPDFARADFFDFLFLLFVLDFLRDWLECRLIVLLTLGGAEVGEMSGG